jgi:hypothetical protein
MRFTRRKFIRLTSNGIILPLMMPINLYSQPAGHGEITLSQEALQIHREALVIDGHNDMPGNILDKKLNLKPGFTLNEPQAELQTDILRLRKGGVDAQVFVAYISPDHMRTGGGNQACIEQIKLIHQLAKSHSDALELAVSANDISRIAGQGKIAALVGVAPMNRDSGSYKGKRFIRGGRHKVRTVLFVSILSAIQCHAKLKPMYERMVAAGKPKKLAIVACMRKQLIILNTMMKNGTEWDPNMA